MSDPAPRPLVLLAFRSTLLDSRASEAEALTQWLRILQSVQGIPPHEAREIYAQRVLGEQPHPTQMGQHLLQGYEKLAAARGLPPSALVQAACLTIGQQYVRRIPAPLPGAIDTLRYLLGHTRLILWGVGDPAQQARQIEFLRTLLHPSDAADPARLALAGATQVCDPDLLERKALRRYLAAMHYSERPRWVIGNDFIRHIQPALLERVRALHIYRPGSDQQGPTLWDEEQVKRYRSVASLHEVPALFQEEEGRQR